MCSHTWLEQLLTSGLGGRQQEGTLTEGLQDTSQVNR